MANDYNCGSDTCEILDTSSDIETLSDFSDAQNTDSSINSDLSNDGSENLPESETSLEDFKNEKTLEGNNKDNLSNQNDYRGRKLFTPYCLNVNDFKKDGFCNKYDINTLDNYEKTRISNATDNQIFSDTFYNPRYGETCDIIQAKEIFINNYTNEVNGINFYKNDEFCCSYIGKNYSDIKDSNYRDCGKENLNNC